MDGRNNVLLLFLCGRLSAHITKRIRLRDRSGTNSSETNVDVVFIANIFYIQPNRFVKLLELTINKSDGFRIDNDNDREMLPLTEKSREYFFRNCYGIGTMIFIFS